MEYNSIYMVVDKNDNSLGLIKVESHIDIIDVVLRASVKYNRSPSELGVNYIGSVEKEQD